MSLVQKILPPENSLLKIIELQTGKATQKDALFQVIKI
jgi:hypothetical protein